MAKLKQTWQYNQQTDMPKYQIKVSDTGEETVIITQVVHTINMGDIEDPDVMIAEPIWQWQQTDAGKWIMDNSNPTPSWHRFIDPNTYGYLYQIRAYLTHAQLTYYKLKYE
jgi:hypothetical protein